MEGGREMNGRPTPETDAKEAWPASNLKLGNDGVVPAGFARRLERERDEAREALDEARKYLKWIHDVADSQRKWNFRTLAKEGLMKAGGVK
jgi:hypothetical protein